MTKRRRRLALSRKEQDKAIKELERSYIFCCSIEVDYTLTLQELIKLGRYDYVDPQVVEALTPAFTRYDGTRLVSMTVRIPDLTKDYPKRFGPYDVYEREASSRAEVRWAFADVRDLLVFGAMYPRVQQQFAIVAEDLGIFPDGPRIGPHPAVQGCYPYLSVRPDPQRRPFANPRTLEITGPGWAKRPCCWEGIGILFVEKRCIYDAPKQRLWP